MLWVGTHLWRLPLEKCLGNMNIHTEYSLIIKQGEPFFRKEEQHILEGKTFKKGDIYTGIRSLLYWNPQSAT